MRKLMVAKMYVALLLLAFMFCSTSIIAQSSWGIGSEFHTSRLTPMKSFHQGYGKVDFRHDFSVCPVFYYKLQFRDNFAFETGIGYTGIRYTLYFEREAFMNVYYSSFHMALQYLHVPIKLQYRLPVNNKSSVHNWSGALGLKNRILINYDNNINDLSLTDGPYVIDLNFYSRYVASAELSLAYDISLRNEKSIEFYLFCNRDLTPFIKRSRLFSYNALFYTMRGMQFGLGFKYFM